MQENVVLSIVIPLLNEEESLRPLFDKIEDAMADMGITYEVIFVDDGSRDGSIEVLKELHQQSD
jgi:glycosyltransferase involved in cell wall biosynthesis